MAQRKVTFFETDAGDGIGFCVGNEKCTVNRFGETFVRHRLQHKAKHIPDVVPSNRQITKRDLRCGRSYLMTRDDAVLFVKCNDLNLFAVGFVGANLNNPSEDILRFEVENQEVCRMLESGSIIEVVAAT